jgi:signal transduction histidine kinase
MSRSQRVRFGIALKLLLWSLALMAVFLATTLYLFNHIRHIVRVSNEIVTVNAAAAETADRLIQVLLSLVENKKRFEILGNASDRAAFLADLKRYGDYLALARLDLSEPDEAWAKLEELYHHALAPDPATGQPNPHEESISGWIEALTNLRQAQRREMSQRMSLLHEQSARAEQVGLIGLSWSFALGLLGTIVLTFFLNRALKELRAGLGRLGRGGDFGPVKVFSRDELGALAAAFNDLAERLKREERLRSDFISMLSHELRTPLTSIREAVNLLKEGLLGPVNPRQVQFLDVSSREMERLSDLLARLMQVSSLEEGREPRLRPAPAGLAGLIQDALTRLAPAAQARQVELEALPPEPDPLVLADPDHLRQVLLNLVGNALKFSPAGRTVTVSAQVQADGRAAVVRVADQGPGIPAEEKPFVFDKYYRAAAVRDRIDGAGLGLSISKRIVEAHGGEMWLEDREGGGSVFSFTLPLAEKVE